MMDMLKTRAAVAWGPAQPLAIEEVDLMPPRQGEVLVRIVATGVCHTDAFTLSGISPCPCVARIAWHRLVFPDVQNLHLPHSGV